MARLPFQDPNWTPFAMKSQPAYSEQGYHKVTLSSFFKRPFGTFSGPPVRTEEALRYAKGSGRYQQGRDASINTGAHNQNNKHKCGKDNRFEMISYSSQLAETRDASELTFQRVERAADCPQTWAWI